MKVVWTREALADLADIATYYASNASPVVAEAVGRRFVTSWSASVARLSRRHALRTVPRFVSQRSSATHSGYFTVSVAT